MTHVQKCTADNLSKLYNIYTDKNGPYVARFLKHLKDEANAIALAFPELNFCTTARIKSKKSFMKKVIQKLEEGKTPEISDIFANKYIIQSINFPDGRYSLNETLRINYCYKLALFLNEYNSRTSRNLVSRKDYIKNPKDLYQSLHLQYADFSIPEEEQVAILDLPDKFKEMRFETQIKTAEMRYQEKDGITSHEKIYKPRTLLDFDLIPTYIEPIYKPNQNIPSEFQVSDFETSFEKYYRFSFESLFGISFDEFSTLPSNIQSKLVETHSNLRDFSSEYALNLFFKLTSKEASNYYLEAPKTTVPNDSEELKNLILPQEESEKIAQKFENLHER